MPDRDRVFIPAALRVPAGVAAALAGVVVLVLGTLYAGGSRPGRVDGHLDRAVDVLPVGHRLARLVTVFGSPGLVVVGAAGVAVGCLLGGRLRAAALAVAGPGLTGLVTTFGKPVVDRTIGHGGLAFPSGHTGGATSLALVVALLAAAALGLRPPGTAALVGTGAVVAGGAVGTGMVLLGAHYPTDAIGGFCTAVAAVLLVALTLDAVFPGRPAPSTPVPLTP